VLASQGRKIELLPLLSSAELLRREEHEKGMGRSALHPNQQ